MPLGCKRMFCDVAIVSAHPPIMTTEPNRALDLTFQALLPLLSPLFPPDIAPCSHVEELDRPSAS